MRCLGGAWDVLAGLKRLELTSHDTHHFYLIQSFTQQKRQFLRQGPAGAAGRSHGALVFSNCVSLSDSRISGRAAVFITGIRISPHRVLRGMLHQLEAASSRHHIHGSGPQLIIWQAGAPQPQPALLPLFSWQNSLCTVDYLAPYSTNSTPILASCIHLSCTIHHFIHLTVLHTARDFPAAHHWRSRHGSDQCVEGGSPDC